MPPVPVLTTQRPFDAGAPNRVPSPLSPTVVPVPGDITPVSALVPVQFVDVPYSNCAVVEAPNTNVPPHTYVALVPLIATICVVVAVEMATLTEDLATDGF